MPEKQKATPDDRLATFEKGRLYPGIKVGGRVGPMTLDQLSKTKNGKKVKKKVAGKRPPMK